MFHKIKSVYPIENYCIVVIFSEGFTKEYDVKPLFKELPAFKALKNKDIFNNVRVTPGGYGIIWNDSVDLACDELFNHGKKIDTVFDNLLSFADAAQLWNIDESTLRKAIKSGKLTQGVDACKFGKQWVVSISVMEREYGPRKI